MRALTLLLFLALFFTLEAEISAVGLFKTRVEISRRGDDLQISLNAVQQPIDMRKTTQQRPVLFVRCLQNGATESTCRRYDESCLTNETQVPPTGIYLSFQSCMNATTRQDVFLQPLTQQEAMAAVIQQGLVVASLLSPAEFQAVGDLLRESGQTEAWMALVLLSPARRKRDTTLYFMTSDGRNVSATELGMPWAPNEPNVTVGNCVVFAVLDNETYALKMKSCSDIVNATVIIAYVSDSIPPELLPTTTASVATVSLPTETGTTGADFSSQTTNTIGEAASTLSTSFGSDSTPGGNLVTTTGPTSGSDFESAPFFFQCPDSIGGISCIMVIDTCNAVNASNFTALTVNSVTFPNPNVCFSGLTGYPRCHDYFTNTDYCFNTPNISCSEINENYYPTGLFISFESCRSTFACNTYSSANFCSNNAPTFVQCPTGDGGVECLPAESNCGQAEPLNFSNMTGFLDLEECYRNRFSACYNGIVTACRNNRGGCDTNIEFQIDSYETYEDCRERHCETFMNRYGVCSNSTGNAIRCFDDANPARFKCINGAVCPEGFTAEQVTVKRYQTIRQCYDTGFPACLDFDSDLICYNTRLQCSKLPAAIRELVGQDSAWTNFSSCQTAVCRTEPSIEGQHTYCTNETGSVIRCANGLTSFECIGSAGGCNAGTELKGYFLDYRSCYGKAYSKCYNGMNYYCFEEKGSCSDFAWPSEFYTTTLYYNASDCVASLSRSTFGRTVLNGRWMGFYYDATPSFFRCKSSTYYRCVASIGECTAPDTLESQGYATIYDCVDHSSVEFNSTGLVKFCIDRPVRFAAQTFESLEINSESKIYPSFDECSLNTCTILNSTISTSGGTVIFCKSGGEDLNFARCMDASKNTAVCIEEGTSCPEGFTQNPTGKGYSTSESCWQSLPNFVPLCSDDFNVTFCLKSHGSICSSFSLTSLRSYASFAACESANCHTLDLVESGVELCSSDSNFSFVRCSNDITSYCEPSGTSNCLQPGFSQYPAAGFGFASEAACWANGFALCQWSNVLLCLASPNSKCPDPYKQVSSYGTFEDCSSAICQSFNGSLENVMYCSNLTPKYKKCVLGSRVQCMTASENCPNNPSPPLRYHSLDDCLSTAFPLCGNGHTAFCFAEPQLCKTAMISLEPLKHIETFVSYSACSSLHCTSGDILGSANGNIVKFCQYGQPEYIRCVNEATLEVQCPMFTSGCNNPGLFNRPPGDPGYQTAKLCFPEGIAFCNQGNSSYCLATAGSMCPESEKSIQISSFPSFEICSAVKCNKASPTLLEDISMTGCLAVY